MEKTAALEEQLLSALKASGVQAEARPLRLLVAYSGGLDSTVLLHLLSRLQERHFVQLAAAYYHHNWRGTPPPELPRLHKNCVAFNVPFFMLPPEKDTPQTEAAAREVRYEALTQLGDNLAADAVLTAHHADDQVETILFRLFRGTGLDGLSGIQKRIVFKDPDFGDTPVVRPLLAVPREELKAYAEANQLYYFEDPSNQSEQMRRNIIRHHLLPEILKDFPDARQALIRLSEVSQGELSIVREALEPIWQRVSRVEPRLGVTLDTITFNQLGHTYQRRLIKRFLEAHQSAVTQERIDTAIVFVSGEQRLRRKGAPLESLDNDPVTGQPRFLSLYKDRLSVVKFHKRSSLMVGPVSPATPDDDGAKPLFSEVIRVEGAGDYEIPWLDAQIRIVELEEDERKDPSRLIPTDYRQVNIDLSRVLEEGLAIRTRRPGDRIQPFGLEGTMRLKRYFINKGVARFERDEIPLLVNEEDEVLWVPGVGISERLRVFDAPTHCLKLENMI
jgi:tRNA(Ile)-lysidine synthase